MRVAMLSWESLHSIAVGGVAAHVTELAAALARKGHEAHIFTRIVPGQRYHDCIDGVHYHRCSYAPHPEFVDDVNSMCRAFVDRVFEVEDYVGHFDIVHAHDWLTANAMIWIKRGRGHTCVLTFHATEYARCGNTFPGGRSHRVRDQERAGAYWADRIVAVSQSTKNEIMWMYEVPDRKTTVVHNGVSPHRFDLSIDAEAVRRSHDIGPLDPTVLFAGRLAWQKGPDLLVEAIPMVLSSHPNAKFVFAGDGEMRGSLEARARQLGVAHAVRFLGYRNGNDLPALFQICDTACVPSRNEPFGIVILEAWSARKPVVVTQNGGPNEYVCHEFNGLKIFPRPDSVAWGIRTMFSNFDRARWMGNNGRRTVEDRFTWDGIADLTLSVYDPEGALAAAAAAAAQPQPAEQPIAADTAPREAAGEPAIEEGPPVHVMARLSFPTGRTKEAAAEALAACKEELAESGLRLLRRNGQLILEGMWGPVLGAVRRCCHELGASAEAQLIATVRFHVSDEQTDMDEEPFAAGAGLAAARASRPAELEPAFAGDIRPYHGPEAHVVAQGGAGYGESLPLTPRRA